MRRMFIFMWCVVLLLAACGGGDDEETPVPVQPSPTPFVNPTLPEARPVLPTAVSDVAASEPITIKIVQGVANLPPVHIWLDERQVAYAIEALEISQQIQTTAGEHMFKVTEVGSRGDAEVAVIYEASLTISDGEILILNGLVDAIHVDQLVQNVEKIEPGYSQLTLANYMADVTTVTVVFNREVLLSVENTRKKGDPVVLVADTYTLYILVNGVFVERLDLTLERGLAYTLIVTGSLENAAVLVHEAETLPQTAIRITNAAPDAPPLRIVLENQLIADNLAFAQTQDFQVLASGNYLANILEAGTDEVLVGSARLSLQPYEIVDVVVYGPDDNLRIGVYAVDTSPISSDRSRLTLIHAVIGVDAVSMTNASGSEFGLRVRYGGSDSLEIDPTTSEFQFFSGDNEPIETPVRALTIEANKSYTYIVTGRSQEYPIFLSSDLRTESPSSDGEDEGLTPIEGAENTSRVYIVNLYNDPIRVDFDNETMIFGLGSNTISPPFPMIIDYYPIMLYSTTTGQLLSEGEVWMRAGERAFVIYVLPDATIVTTGELDGGPSPVLTRVRFVHAALNASSLHVDTLDPDDDYDATLDYGQMSASFDLPVGINGFEILNGTTFEPVIAQTTLQFEGGRNYEVVLLTGTDGVIGLLILERQP